MDLRHGTIENIFFKQMKMLSIEAKRASVVPSVDEVEAVDSFDVYAQEGIMEYVDNDAMTSVEAGFMQGYLGA